MDDFTCRHCGRPIAVPASNCPWCRQPIMVICANCKAYTDDQKPYCEQCGAPLQPDRMERIALLAHHPEVARLAQDRERAQLVASAVVIANLGGFFYDDGRGHRTVLAELLGSVRDRKVSAAGVIFAAYGYLCQKGYCSVQLSDDGEHLALTRLRPWDGQRESIEGALVEQAARVLTTREATDGMIRELMGFRVTMVRAAPLRGPLGVSFARRPKPRDASERSAFTAIDQVARLTVLPEHDRQEACRATYRLLVEFMEADRERARLLALETLRLLDWFERYERDPAIGLER
nr:zinc ribbon domain-containing protein [Anaerolineae bacterium]